MLKLDGMIFDLDGTLAHTLPVCFAAFREVFETYLGRTYSDDEIYALFGPSEEGIVANLIPEQSEAAYRAYLDAYERAHATCPAPFAGVERALALLVARDVRVAIVTAKGAGSAAISVRRLGLDRHFNIIEAGSAAGNLKPRSIRKVLDEWGLGPERVAYVGDSIHDLHASREVGTLPIAAAWAATARVDALRDERPFALFASVDDFSAWIEREVDGG